MKGENIMKALTIKDIILEKIAATGADGLCNPAIACYCVSDSLFNGEVLCCDCGEMSGSCVLAIDNGDDYVPLEME